ncbi:MAG: transglycosylase SLT domain-containing protein [Myxococcales bacterium]|nr:transglycosylase SLT domain-containing protein [Myxococcales bacterium]
MKQTYGWPRLVARLFFLAVLIAAISMAVAWDDSHAAKRTQFRDAETALAQKQKAKAIKLFTDLARSDWPAADWAVVRLVEIGAAGQDRGMQTTWRSYLVEQMPYSRYRPAYLLDLARDRLDDDQPAEAAARLKQYLHDYPDREPAQARYLLGEALQGQGKNQEAADAYAEAAWWYTGEYSAQAQNKLVLLARAGVAVSTPSAASYWARIRENLARKLYWTAQVYAGRYADLFPGSPLAFRAKLTVVDCLVAQRKTNEAKETLRDLNNEAAGDEQKLAVAVRLKRYDDKATDDAKRDFYQRIARAKTGTASLDAQLALYQLEWNGRDYAAAARWADAAFDEHAGDVFLPEDLLWQAAFAHYLAGEYPAAADRLRRWLAAYPLHSDSDRAQYWLGRSYEKLGNREDAKKIHRQCFDRWQGTYYGLAAEARLLELGVPGKELPVIPFADVKAGSGNAKPVLLRPEWQQQNGGGTVADESTRRAIDDYIASAPPKFAAIFSQVRELLAMNETDEAEARLDFIRDEIYQTAEGPYFLSVAYALVEDNLSATRAAYRALEQVRDGRLADPQGLVSYRVFPLLYEDLIKQTAKKHGLDPYLVYGMIKQESAFQIQATSGVGARGLLQVMPGTGKYIARKRGLRGFHPKHLYQPEVSLDYGCWFMADLMQKSGGDLPAALAGYNAGWGRPKQWWPLHDGRDYDELIELIPFEETRNYVKGITKNYEMYARLYGDGGKRMDNRPTKFILLGKKVAGLP